MKNSKKYISWFTVLILGLVFTMQFIPAKGIAASEEKQLYRSDLREWFRHMRK